MKNFLSLRQNTNSLFSLKENRVIYNTETFDSKSITFEEVLGESKGSLDALKKKVGETPDVTATDIKESDLIDSKEEDELKDKLVFDIGKALEALQESIGLREDEISLDGIKHAETLSALETAHKAIIEGIKKDSEFVLAMNPDSEARFKALQGVLVGEPIASAEGIKISDMDAVLDHVKDLEPLATDAGKKIIVALKVIATDANFESVRFTKDGLEGKKTDSEEWEKIDSNGVMKKLTGITFLATAIELEKKEAEVVTQVAGKSALLILSGKTPDDFSTIEKDTEKQSTLVIDVLGALYNQDNKDLEAIQYEENGDITKVVEDIYKNINVSGDKSISEMGNPENQKLFKKFLATKIEKSVKDKKESLSDAEKKEPVFISFENENILVRSNTEQQDMINKANETTISGADSQIMNILKEQGEYKKEFKGMGKVIAWFLKSFLGYDITDPSASGPIVELGRMIAGVKAPKEDVNYSFADNDSIRSAYLSQEAINYISQVNPIDLSILSKPRTPSVFNPNSLADKASKIWTSGPESAKSKNLMGDVIRKFPTASVSHIGKGQVTFSMGSLGAMVQAGHLLQPSSGGEEAQSQLMSSVTGGIASAMGDLGDIVSGDLLNPATSVPKTDLLPNRADIHEAIGYPDIKGVSYGKGNSITVNWDTGMAEKILPEGVSSMLAPADKDKPTS